jgi:hypothetical protein
MTVSVTEYRELLEMRGNIRRAVDSLEVCWSCQNVCECDAAVVDDGPPVWLCDGCSSRAVSRELLALQGTAWPEAS